MNKAQIIAAVKRARRFCLNGEKARFGDCGPVSFRLVEELAFLDIACQMDAGTFQYTAHEENDKLDHTWVILHDGTIIDPTVDQFFSDLDIDLVTTHPGIYFPPVDGDYLVSRYSSWRRAHAQRSEAVS